MTPGLSWAAFDERQGVGEPRAVGSWTHSSGIRPLRPTSRRLGVTPPSLLLLAEGVAQTGVASGGLKTIR